jgi:uncharacterized protein (DUF885 family)
MTIEPVSPIDALADRYLEALLELNPDVATMYGDERYDDRLPDPSGVGRDRARSVNETVLREAGAIDPSGLSVEEAITRDVLLIIAGSAIEQDDQRIDVLRVVDQIQGPQTLLPQLVQFQRADTPERVERLLARLRAYGPFMAANAELIREGAAMGLTPARVAADRTIVQLEGLLAVPIGEAIVPALLRGASDETRERVREVVRDVVYPADAAFLAAIKEAHAQTREDPGMWALPRGDELYRTQIRAWTTLDIDPAEVHRIGLEQLAAIQDEQRAIASAAGFDGDLAAYRAHLADDPENHPATPEALLARAREDIGRAMAVAPRYFGRLPRAGCEVRAVEAFKEKDAPFAYYNPPDIEGTRDGVYYANTYDLPSRMFSSLATTTFHEAVPGHHFQIALEMESDRLSKFRRLGARAAGGAYVEGWGLYSERLADEMGLYRNDQERYGMLTAQAWRAARLVVDSGMHGLRWTRQQSIDFLDQAGLTMTDAVIETDRYIVWPGQALTYMLGQLEIQGLRRQLEARDGEAFDLRGFHDAVLGHGSLPLATLRAHLPDWVGPRS